TRAAAFFQRALAVDAADLGARHWVDRLTLLMREATQEKDEPGDRSDDASGGITECPHEFGTHELGAQRKPGYDNQRASCGADRQMATESRAIGVGCAVGQLYDLFDFGNHASAGRTLCDSACNGEPRGALGADIGHTALLPIPL